MASYVQLGQSGKVYGHGKPPRKKKNKKIGRIIAYVLLVAILVIGIGAMAGTIVWMSSTPEQDDDIGTTSHTINVRPPSHSTAPVPTVPTSTATTKPSFTTGAPTIHYVSGTSGSFVGNEGYKVKLIVEYGVVKNASGAEELNVRVFLQSFALGIGERKGEITINGKKYPFRSETIDLQENVRHKILLTEQKVALDGVKEFSINAQWTLNATYSQVKIEDLSASGVITLP